MIETTIIIFIFFFFLLCIFFFFVFFFFSSRRRHTRSLRDWSSDVCSSDLARGVADLHLHLPVRADQPAQQHPRGLCAQVMAPLVAANRHRVGQHRGS